MNATPNEHIVKSFDTELARLTGEIVRMGEIAVTQIEAAMDVLERRDSRAAERVISNDDAIDSLENMVGHDVIKLLVMRTPVARDLRAKWSPRAAHRSGYRARRRLRGESRQTFDRAEPRTGGVPGARPACARRTRQRENHA